MVPKASPLRSLHELHVETGIAMPMIFELALHLRRCVDEPPMNLP